MSVKITTQSGTFDLPSDFNIEIEDTSPVFNDQGSQSTSATIPSSKNNLRLVKYINRTDTDQAPVEDARITVSDGIYHRVGKMNITQASHSTGIVSNIGFDESEIYNIWNSVTLRSFEGLPKYSPENGVEDVITYLDDIMNDRKTDTPFHVFQICVAIPETKENDADVYYPEYLNSIIKEGEKYNLNGAARTETYLLNSEVVATSVPIGYGITPFLKVPWLLDYIFNSFGYHVTENPFSTHPQLSRLVVLNNAADCCVKGFIDYSDLMPDCTINELLQALYCRFGMVYFVDGKTKTVRLRFIKDIITSPASQDWSKLKAAEPITNYNTPKQLKLSAATSISGPYPLLVASPAADSLDKFLKPYGYIVGEQDNDGYLSYAQSNGTYCVRNLRTRKLGVVSSDFFPWDKEANIDYEDISSVDECLPIKASAPDDNYACPAYLFGKIHRYTNISSSDVNLSEKSENTSPLCFCFSLPTTRPCGSPRCYGSNGQVVDKNGHTYDISMTFVGENGLFNRFWKDYDAILRHANHTIEAKLHLEHKQLLNADFSTPVALDGQRLLVDTQRYQLPLHFSLPATVNLRTIKLLKPYDLDKEQGIHTIPQLYKWVLFNNRESVYNSVCGEQIRQWQTAVKPPATWIGVNRKNEVSDETSDAEIPFTVPTKDDFDNKRTHFIKQVNYSFDLYYKIRVIKNYTSTGIPIYEEKEYGGVHFEFKYNLWIQATGI